MEDVKIKDLTGVTGFLNGQEGLHSMEEKLCEAFKKQGKDVLVIDDLFNKPERLIEIKKCDNIVLSTTGIFQERLQKLLGAFDKLNYAPKKVIFMGENTALILCGTARELKKAHGTEFYFPDILSNDLLYPIVWI